MSRTQEKLNVMTVPIQLNNEQYAQICAKADHDHCKPEDIIQEAVEVFLEQMNGEKVVLDIDMMLEGYALYCRDGHSEHDLRQFWERNKLN
jgi:hypothetical protein